jgi:hypothetical protein
MPHKKSKTEKQEDTIVEKRPVGRPCICNTPEELQIAIDEYFLKGMPLKKVIVGPPNNRRETLIAVPSISGLSLYCGFSNRASFYDYEKKPEFTHTIKKARSRIEQHYEELLQTGLGSGAIFALKNFGWIDKTELEHSGEIKGNFIVNIKQPNKLLSEKEINDVSSPGK